MKILVTSGGTKIPIDRVRSITNMSRGTFGSRIADEFWHNGLERKLDKRDGEDIEQIEKITFFMAKGSKRPNAEDLHNAMYDDDIAIIEYREYSTFDEYKDGIEKLLSEEKFDIIVVAAAVSDYGVANYYNGKYRSREDDMCIKLVKLPKILPIMRKLAPNSTLCGFKLLVDSTNDELLQAMIKQFEESNVDLVVGNDLRDIKNDNHKLFIMSKHNLCPRLYMKEQGDARQSLVYPLAKNVVDECFKEYTCKNVAKE